MLRNTRYSIQWPKELLLTNTNKFIRIASLDIHNNLNGYLL